MNITLATTGIIGVLLGLTLGFVVFSNKQNSEPHTIPASHTVAMAHPSIEVSTALPVPSVVIEAIPDTKDGYNVHIMTSNFTWSPERVNTAPTQGEGHAHVYVNDVKLGRLYGEWYHISNDMLSAGTNVIEVTLNANDHSEWVHNDDHIAASATIEKR